MGKFDGVLLVTDFDDTYFPESGVLPPANRAAVTYFKAQGGTFTVATGRAYTTFAPKLPVTPVNAPVILSNGAQLYDFAAGQMLLERTLPPTIAADLIDLARRLPEVGLEAYHGEDAYIWNPNPWTWYHLNKAGVGAQERPIAAIPQPWSKAILHQDYDILLQAQTDLLTYHGDRYEAIFSNFHMLEITAKGVTKGGMVLELARRLGIDRAHIYCAGDNQNDLPMLRIAQEGYAPADCADAVRFWGPHLLPPCEDGAIAALIADLDRRY